MLVSDEGIGWMGVSGVRGVGRRAVRPGKSHVAAETQPKPKAKAKANCNVCRCRFLPSFLLQANAEPASHKTTLTTTNHSHTHSPHALFGFHGPPIPRFTSICTPISRLYYLHIMNTAETETHPASQTATAARQRRTPDQGVKTCLRQTELLDGRRPLFHVHVHYLSPPVHTINSPPNDVPSVHRH